ncbi:MAG: carboxypeptidase-like regulatory domain-containing protein, partial [bacterium]
MSQKFLVVILLSFTSIVFSQSTGKIAGVITDAETGAPLLGANVLVTQTLLGAITDVDGRFVVRQVPPGVHLVRVSYIGYHGEQARIRV